MTRIALTLFFGCLFFLHVAASDDGNQISVNYEKQTITIGSEVLSLTKEQKESYQEWKKMLDENGPTNDLHSICPHLNDMINVSDDDEALIAFTKEHPHEMLIIKYNLKLRQEAQLKKSQENKE